MDEALTPEMKAQAEKMKMAKEASKMAKKPGGASPNDVSEIKGMLKKAGASKKDVAKMAAEMASSKAQEGLEMEQDDLDTLSLDEFEELSQEEAVQDDGEPEAVDEPQVEEKEEEQEEKDEIAKIQEGLLDILSEKRKIRHVGPPRRKRVKGRLVTYRRRRIIGKPDPRRSQSARRAARKGKVKRSQAIRSYYRRGARKKRSESLAESSSFASELVEYTQGGGTLDNAVRIAQSKPPVIHGIEDVADSIDWHLLRKGISSEHLETALSKDGKKVVLFMDDRAQPRLSEVREIMAQFGTPHILQKADELDENTGQPHGFYVFELEPDEGMYTPKPEEPSTKDTTWDSSMQDSQEDDVEQKTAEEAEEPLVVLEGFEPHCSTCGSKIADTSAYMEDENVLCLVCDSQLVPLNEHAFNGIFCARHGSRLDKYSRVCYECLEEQNQAVEEPDVLCPECKSQTNESAESCAVCGTEFEDEVVDYSAHLADSLFKDEDDDEILEMSNAWDDEGVTPDPFDLDLDEAGRGSMSASGRKKPEPSKLLPARVDKAKRLPATTPKAPKGKEAAVSHLSKVREFAKTKKGKAAIAAGAAAAGYGAYRLWKRRQRKKKERNESVESFLESLDTIRMLAMAEDGYYFDDNEDLLIALGVASEDDTGLAEDLESLLDELNQLAEEGDEEDPFVMGA